MGPSGSGKSSLALALMAYGAKLVADDRTEILLRGDDVVATCSPVIAGMIEARGMGLLNAEVCIEAAVRLVVDLGQIENQRFPPHRNVTWFGCTLPLVFGQTSPHFPAVLWQYVKAGRRE
jgi:HPr kinase/phosphorylase